MSEPDFITEPSRNIPVYRRCDVLLVGGGPAGCAAAVSAVHMGADVVLVESVTAFWEACRPADSSCGLIE